VFAVLAAAVIALLLASPHAGAATSGTSYSWLSSASFGDGDSFIWNVQLDSMDLNPATGHIVRAVNFPGTVRVYGPDANAGGVALTSFDTGFFSSGLAVDPDNGSVYVTDYEMGAIVRYLSDGAPVPTYTLDSSFSPSAGILGNLTGVAVDPVTHDLLVSDFSLGRVSRLSSSTGAMISSFDGSDTPKGAFIHTGGLAVGPSRAIYVVDADQNHWRVDRMSPSGESLGSLPIGERAQPLSVATNPSTGDVYVVVAVAGRLVLEGFTATGQPTFSYPIPPAMSGSPNGLAADPTTGRIYLAVDNGVVHTFVPATQPGIDAPVISQISASGAHATSSIAPGGETTSARIEYCPAAAACSSHLASDPTNPENPWVRLPDHPSLDGTGEVTIENDLDGLEPNTSYRVRVFASNALTENTSAETTFTTSLSPPVVQTGPAAGVTDSRAELTGTINTIGGQTTYHFEYGLTTNYGTSAPSGAEGVAGKGRTPRAFKRTITGLQPGTTYHYRLVARNPAGESVGADRTFTTQGSDEVAPRRGYEQVTPVDKKGGSVNPVLGFHAAPDGSAIAYQALSAPSDAAAAVLESRYLSRRGASDWLRWQQMDPPLNVSRAVIDFGTHAVSPGFTHALVVTNRALVPGAIENGGNLYVVDLRSGAYELVAAANGLTAYLKMAGPNTNNMYLGGAPDFSWIVFASATPLLPGVTGAALYKWSRAGGLVLESRLPDGGVPGGGVSMQTLDRTDARQVSDDGNTVYFALNTGEEGVYLRTGGQTTAISVSEIAGDSATQPGVLDGVSRDGRYAIFRSGRLTDDAPATPGSYLYQYDAETGDLRYLATVAGMDQGRVIDVADDAQTVYFNDGANTAVWHRGELGTVVASWHPDITTSGGMQAFASPNGRYLVYRGPDHNVYLYDAETDEGVCASCPPDGSAGGDGEMVRAGNRTISNRTPQVVTDNGMAFFDTAVRLVSSDHNGSRDVYSYQDGQLTLISPGDGNFAAWFADASADGSDVFFTTGQPLVNQDDDQALDLYDARVGGGFPGQSPPAPPAPCAKTECAEAGRGPVESPPVVAPPQPGPTAKRTNETRVRISLGKVSIGSKSVRISVRASQSGRVRVTGTRVSTTVRNVPKAGTYSMTVPLSKKARALLRSHRKVKVALKVTLAGGWGTSTAKYSRTLGK
jgi:DNA-binding beta-propeller fold protein YncE